MPRRARRRRVTARDAGRVAGAVGLVGVAVGVGARSASGAFSAIVAATNQSDTGTLALELPPSGGVNRLNVNVPQILPGDSIYRAFDLKISGSVDYSVVAILPEIHTSSLLDTNQITGLQYTIDRCSVPWTESGSSPDFSYTCSGTTANVMGPSPIGAGTKVTSNLNVAAGATNYLRLTTSLPSTSLSTMQGQTTDVEFWFYGTSRSGTNK